MRFYGDYSGFLQGFYTRAVRGLITAESGSQGLRDCRGFRVPDYFGALGTSTLLVPPPLEADFL